MSRVIGRANRLRRTLTGRAESGFVSSVQTLLANILILFVNVATGIITARALGPDGRGLQAAIILWPGLLTGVSTLGLPAALLFYVRRTGAWTASYLSAALFIGGLLGGAAALVGVVLTPVWLASYGNETVRIVQLYMLFVPVALLSLLYTGLVQGQEDFRRYNTLRLLQPLVTLALLASLALTDSMTPAGAAFAFLVPCLPATLWVWWRTRNVYRLTRRFRAEARQLLSYGLRSYGVDLLGVFTNQIDKIMIVSLLSTASMGFYAVAFSLSRTLGVFQAATVSVLLPKLIGQPLPEIVALAGRAARLSTLITVAAAASLIVLGPHLITFFYGDSFASASLVFQLLLLDSVIGGLDWVLVQVFNATGRPGLITVRQALSLVLTVPLMYLLGATYGIVGIAAALLLGSSIRLVLTLWTFPFILKLPVPRLVLTKQDIVYLRKLWQDRVQRG